MRTTLPFVRCGARVAVLLVLAACSSSDGLTAPTPDFDVMQVLTSVTLPAAARSAALGAAGVPGSAVAGSLTSAPAALRNCAWNAGIQAFSCAPFTVNGITTTFGYTPLDAQGAPQRTPDRATTAALRTASTSQGTLVMPGAPPGSAITIDQRQASTIRGLLTDLRTVDGTMTSTLSGGLLGNGRMQLTQTTAGLVLPAADARWPSAGTVTTVITAPVPGQATMQQVITFNGTSTISLVITSAGATQRCTLDLAAPPTLGAAPLYCTAG